MNPGVLQSVCVTARHHALAGQVVRVLRRKRHRGEAYLVVAVEDGSRQLIAVRNTELTDEQLPASGLRFTPGSLRALVEVINECRCRVERAGGTVDAPWDRPASVGPVHAGGQAAGRAALDGVAEASTAPVRHGSVRNRSER